MTLGIVEDIAKPWDCVDQTLHISSLQSVRDVSDIVSWWMCSWSFINLRVIQKFLANIRKLLQISCFEQLTATHICDYFQRGHIYVWIISKNLNSFHFKLFWFCFILWLTSSLCAYNLWQRDWFRPVFLKLGSLELQDSAECVRGSETWNLAMALEFYWLSYICTYKLKLILQHLTVIILSLIACRQSITPSIQKLFDSVVKIVSSTDCLVSRARYRQSMCQAKWSVWG
jgi:hypothetical protein